MNVLGRTRLAFVRKAFTAEDIPSNAEPLGTGAQASRYRRWITRETHAAPGDDCGLLAEGSQQRGDRGEGRSCARHHSAAGGGGLSASWCTWSKGTCPARVWFWRDGCRVRLLRVIVAAITQLAGKYARADRRTPQSANSTWPRWSSVRGSKCDRLAALGAEQLRHRFVTDRGWRDDQLRPAECPKLVGRAGVAEQLEREGRAAVRAWALRRSHRAAASFLLWYIIGGLELTVRSGGAD